MGWKEGGTQDGCDAIRQSIVRNGLLEARVLPDNGFTFDHIDGTKTGESILDKNGNSHTVVDLLEYANPMRIKVYLHAVVHNIKFTTRKGYPTLIFFFVGFVILSVLKKKLDAIRMANWGLTLSWGLKQ